MGKKGDTPGQRRSPKWWHVTPWGWVWLAALLGLAVPTALGVDLRYWLTYFVGWHINPEHMWYFPTWFVALWMFQWNEFRVWALPAVYGPWHALLLCMALWWSGLRWGKTRSLLAILPAFVFSWLALQTYGLGWFSSHDMLAELAAAFVIALPTLVITWALLGGWRVLYLNAAAVCTLTLCVALDWTVMQNIGSGYEAFRVATWLAAGLFVASIAWRAEQLRRRKRRAELGYLCAKCGYDLRGIAGGKCPECGAVKSAMTE